LLLESSIGEPRQDQRPETNLEAVGPEVGRRALTGLVARGFDIGGAPRIDLARRLPKEPSISFLAAECQFFLAIFAASLHRVVAP
jgi:hypothetical protein